MPQNLLPEFVKQFGTYGRALVVSLSPAAGAGSLWLFEAFVAGVFSRASLRLNSQGCLA